jgi:hypothetical protein
MRDKWEFTYQVDQVLAGAKAKHAFHTSRLEWWEKKKDETLAKIKAEGLEIDDSIVNELGKTGYMSNRANRGVTVTINEEMERDLVECTNKIDQHRGKVMSYDNWVQVLSAQPSMSILHLTQEDWVYFYGK